MLTSSRPGGTECFSHPVRAYHHCSLVELLCYACARDLNDLFTPSSNHVQYKLAAGCFRITSHRSKWQVTNVVVYSFTYNGGRSAGCNLVFIIFFRVSWSRYSRRCQQRCQNDAESSGQPGTNETHMQSFGRCNSNPQQVQRRISDSVRAGGRTGSQRGSSRRCGEGACDLQLFLLLVVLAAVYC